jgi:beta-lactamase regulating signal transducer with metallopeptidase domain
MNLSVTVFSEPWVQRLGWVLLHFIWQGTAIALLMALVLRLLAQASSHVRYLVIGGALLICGVMPVVTWTVLGSQPEPHQQPAMASTPIEAPKVEVPAMSDSNSYSNSTLGASVDTGWHESAYRAANTALPYAVYLWFGGVLILTLRLTLGWTLMQRLRLSGLPIHDALCLERFRSLMKRMQISLPVQMMESALVEVPTLIGWLRPTILIPASVLVGLTPDQLEAILAHELAHVRRYDYLVNLFQTVIETILFYHPAVWWISRKLREERENCCDDIALGVMADRLVYVSALAQLEEGRAMSLALSASGGSLLQRIRRITGVSNRKVSSWPLWVLIGGILTVASLTKLEAGGQASDSSMSAASDSSRDADKGSQVNIELKISEIDDDEYLANKDKIDAALKKGGDGIIELLNNMKGVSLLSAPSVTTKPGLKANIEIVRKFPYPTIFDPTDTVRRPNPTTITIIPPTPREFQTRDVGVSAEIMPTVLHDKIALYCNLHITDFVGFTETNQAIKSAAFETREVNLLEEFDKGAELKGAMIPGFRYDEETVTDRDNAGKVVSTTQKTSKKRLVVFLSASLVPLDASASAPSSH